LSASTWRVFLSDAVTQDGKERFRRSAGRVLDRGGHERHAELFLGDEEVEHLAKALVVPERPCPFYVADDV
jgi:hypothetical protein